MMDITLDTPVDDLLAAYPQAAGFLAEHHVVCIVCGEPFWGTLGSLMANKGITNAAELVADLRVFLNG